MFSKAPKTIFVLTLEADLAGGRTVSMPFGAFHLRRAEAEGQLPRIRQYPRLLGDLMASYNRKAPQDDRIVAIRAVGKNLAVKDGRPIRAGVSPGLPVDQGDRPSWQVEVIARWPPAQ